MCTYPRHARVQVQVLLAYHILPPTNSLSYAKINFGRFCFFGLCFGICNNNNKLLLLCFGDNHQCCLWQRLWLLLLLLLPLTMVVMVMVMMLVLVVSTFTSIAALDFKIQADCDTLLLDAVLDSWLLEMVASARADCCGVRCKLLLLLITALTQPT